MTFLNRIAGKVLRQLQDTLLRDSVSRDIDGFWVATSEHKHAAAIFARVADAIAVLAAHDPRRYARVRRDIPRIWVTLLGGNQAQFNQRTGICELDPRFVLGGATKSAVLAATLVHEATHARIERVGIRYFPELRPRIEAACRRQEVAFAEGLTGAQPIVDQANAWVGVPEHHWSNEAFEARRLKASAENLRHLGIPRFLMPVIGVFAATMRALNRGLHGLTRVAADKRDGLR